MEHHSKMLNFETLVKAIINLNEGNREIREQSQEFLELCALQPESQENNLKLFLLLILDYQGSFQFFQ